MSGNPSSTSSLARSSVVMAGGTLVSRVLGVVRMALLAYAIGNLTPAANVWQTANTIPNTIYLLLAAGVLNVLLLPQLTRALTRGKEGQDYSDRLLTLSVVILGVGTVLFVLAAPLATKVTMLTFPWGDPMLDLAILFAYLCIPQMLFYGLHTLLGQILAVYHRFAAFAWSPALANVISIAGILVFMRRYPGAALLPLQEWTSGMIWLLAGSATLSIVVQALVLFPAVRATGFKWRFRWGFRGVGLGTASVMAGWALADVALSQTGVITATNLLNWAVKIVPDAPGKAAYDYAFSIFVLPHSLIALSLLTTIYPVLTKAAAVDDRRGMAVHVARGLRLLGTAMVPLAIGMLVLAPLLARVIYPGNSPESHRAISTILIALVLGLVPYGVYLLCARVFYSFEDARTPFLFQVAITTVLLVVCFLAFLQAPIHVAIFIAFGQALGQVTAAILGLRAVRRRLPWIGLRAVGRSYLRAAAAAALALVPMWLLIRLLDRPGFAGAALTLAVSGAAFLLVYAVLAHLFGVREVAEVTSPLLRRIPGLKRWAPAPLPPTSGPAPSPAPAPAQNLPGGTPRHTDDTSTPGVGTIGHQLTSESVTETVPVLDTLGWDGPPTGVAGKDGEMDRLEVGTQLGDRYILDELLARREGGTLDYWSAHDVTLGRLVAVTVLPAGAEHTESAHAVLDAARQVASVDDPRLVRVLDVGEEDGLAWIIEEGLSEAESLASLVSTGPLPAEEARRIVGESAAGLESARRRGLHHLYLNPHSVLRTSDGTVKVSGVGMSAALEGVDDVTPVEASLIDAADLVSLLYVGLTGQWPAEDLVGVRSARRVEDGSFPAPSELVGGVPGDLDALCRLVHGSDADLAKAPGTPGELARQLSPWASEMVRDQRPAALTPPPQEHGQDDATKGAMAAVAGASAAATAAHPTTTDDDATSMVPKPFYRSTGAPGTPVDPADRSRGGRDRYAEDDAGDPRPQADREGSGDVDRLLGGREDTDAHVRASGAGATARGADRTSTADLLGIRSTGERVGSRPRRAQPPGRLGADPDPDGLPEERGTGGQTLAVLLVVLGILGLAAVLGWSVLRGMGDSPTDSAASPSTSNSTPVETDKGDKGNDKADQTADAPKAPVSSGEALSVLGITSFDPQGDGNENNSLAPLAVDGDEATEWKSHTYLSPGWGSLKTGTGLILDLGEGAQVSKVEVMLGEGDMGVKAYLTEQASLSDAIELGADDKASGTFTATPEQTATGRYLILWFDRAFTSPAGEIVSVREITVR